MEALKSFELGDVKEVSRCQRLDDPGNVTCARFELDKDGRFRLEIIGPYKDRNPISRVTLSEVIVLAHERID
jgi:hypothetical protein